MTTVALETFPNAKEQIVAFGVRNLTTLTLEGVHDFIVPTFIPRLVVVWRNADNHEPQHKLVVDVASETNTARDTVNNADHQEAE
jgi:hypothetical protein